MSENPQESAQPQSKPLEAEAMKPPKLLVVDDDRNMSALICRLLEGYNYQIQVENDARNVMDRLREDSYSLVLVDLVMPYIGGLELVSLIKMEFNLPVIVMTGFASIQSARKAMKAGADDFVTKPIEGEYWDMRIRRVLKPPRR